MTRGVGGRRDWLATLVATSVLAATVLGGIASPAGAGGATQIRGTADFDDGSCDGPPDGFEDFGDFTLILSGDLEGCWYTKVDSVKDNGTPSGIYQERGREVFEGTIDGVEGIFATEYHFTSKWDPEFGDGTNAEVHGRCQHPIVRGLEDFAGLSGRVDLKDDVDFFVTEAPPYNYRGHYKGL